MNRLALVLAITAISNPAFAAPPKAFPPPKSLGPVEKYGAHLQRSMALMATSTGLKRNTVRILFYGQSITNSDWTRIVGERLRRQYPLANLVIENRAISGFDSSKLSKTAEADLYPFYPDLVIFHDYGDAAPYEDMVRRIRERTAADILIATDHIAPRVGEKIDEATDPAKLPAPKPGTHDAAWRSYVFLPALARKYGAELADIRTLWKQYLKDAKLSPSDLLYDDLHLNSHGIDLMAELILAHLRYRPELAMNADDGRVKTLTVGPEDDLQWKDGKLVVPFEGNKIDLICKEGAAAPAAIRIDGKKPSEFPELYIPTRAIAVDPRGPFPPLLRVRHRTPLIIEDWKILITDVNADCTRYKFRVIGSVTGDDGDGEGGKPFVSKSGRVVLDPDDFNLLFPLRRFENATSSSLEALWHVRPHFVDQFVAPANGNHFGETIVTAAQGLKNCKHTLEITGSPDTPIGAIRIYRPPLLSR
jgi:hypothetical protein